jgi:hypothetical protein
MTHYGYYATKATDEPQTYKQYMSGDEWGRVFLPWSASKGRLWFLWGEGVDAYWIDKEPEIAAKSARFEYGETPGG